MNATAVPRVHELPHLDSNATYKELLQDLVKKATAAGITSAGATAAQVNDVTGLNLTEQLVLEITLVALFITLFGLCALGRVAQSFRSQRRARQNDLAVQIADSAPVEDGEEHEHEAKAEAARAAAPGDSDIDEEISLGPTAKDQRAMRAASKVRIAE